MTGIAPRRVQAAAVQSGDGRALPVDQVALMPSVDKTEHALGFEQGYSDGIRHADTRIEAAVAHARAELEQAANIAIAEAVERTQATEARYREGLLALDAIVREDRTWAESLAAELAMMAVTQLLGRHAADHILVAQLCQQARVAVAADGPTIRLNPEDMEEVGQAGDGATWIGDDSLERGSCVVQTSRGRYDAGLRTRLTILVDALVTGLGTSG
jgi:flagellar biosynthesis/type III secretory pathway protein FliH